MFIVTKLIHIKYEYENELLYGLKQYYPSLERTVVLT